MSTALAHLDGITGDYIPAVAFTADPAIAVHAELQRFIKTIMKPEYLWPKINGRPDPPAEELMKLWSPLGCEAEFLSINEFGAPGVHRHKVGETRKGDDIYEFSCTMRVVSRRLGSTVVVEADLSADEQNKRGVETTFLRQQCATRARKTALRILAGFDVDRPESTKAAKRAEDAEKVDGKALLAQAVKCGVIPEADRELLVEYARQYVRGCEDMDPRSVTVKHAQLIAKHLDKLGVFHA